jgi:hypothetical protein
MILVILTTLKTFREVRKMATTQKAFMGNVPGEGAATMGGQRDAAETLIKTVDESTKGTMGVSLFHILTLGSIGASIALFLAGRQQAGIFVGLWPPTFQALKSVVDRNAKRG